MKVKKKILKELLKGNLAIHITLEESKSEYERIQNICEEVDKAEKKYTAAEFIPKDFNYFEEEEELTGLPKYFVIKRDINNPLWTNYLKWLNDKYNSDWQLGNYNFYGYDGSKDFISVDGHSLSQCHDFLSSFKNNPIVLTLEQWDRLRPKEKEFIPKDFNKPIGFVDTYGQKGYFVYAGGTLSGTDFHRAICINDGCRSVSNSSYGFANENKYEIPPQDKAIKGCTVKIETYHQFETLKELHKWLSE